MSWVGKGLFLLFAVLALLGAASSLALAICNAIEPDPVTFRLLGVSLVTAVLAGVACTFPGFHRDWI